MKKNSCLFKVILFLVVILALLLIVLFRINSETPHDSNTTDPTNQSSNTSTSVPPTTTAPTVSKPTDSVPTQPTQTLPPEPTQTTPTQPSTSPTEPSTEPTEPSTSPTEPSTEPTVPSTEPTEPDEPIGTGMYTREELENLPTEKYPYGPGRTSGGARPQYPQQDQKKFGQYGANFIAPDNGNVYLTFDCGYEYTATDENGNPYRVTERILDVLKEKNVKAVFFITLPYAKQNPDLVQRMIDEGHAVGNHSANHPIMPDISIDRMIKEVMDLHDYVLEHFGYEMHLFRPPTGQYSVQSLAVVQNLGYKNVHWSFAYADYDTANQPAYDFAYNLITNNHHSGAIYLLHAVSTTNAAVLSDIIDFFIAQGYHLELFS